MVDEFFEKPAEAFDIYVDSVRVGVGLYTFVLELGSQGIPDAPGTEKPPTKRLALVRMSPQHAKVLGKLIVKRVQAYEDTVAPIPLPSEVYKELDLDPDE